MASNPSFHSVSNPSPRKLMKLRWLPIYGWPEYEVSNRGDVRRAMPGKGARVGKILRPGNLPPFGHRYVVLSARGRQRTRLVSRLMLRAFVGPPPKGKNDAAHRDGDATNDLLSNVRWTSRAGNEGDKVLHGRTNRGSRHGMSKLTEAEVIKIRSLSHLYHKHIAKRFKVSRGRISAIVRRACWKHI